MTIYCVDANTIINMHRNYPRAWFPTIWNNIDTLIQDGRFYVHRQVFEEWKKVGAGECVAWKATLPEVAIIEMDDEQNEFIVNFLGANKYLKHMYLNPENATAADPYLVALGKLRGWCVITDESKTKTYKIPDLCRRAGDVDWTDKWGLLEREKWTF